MKTEASGAPVASRTASSEKCFLGPLTMTTGSLLMETYVELNIFSCFAIKAVHVAQLCPNLGCAKAIETLSFDRLSKLQLAMSTMTGPEIDPM